MEWLNEQQTKGWGIFTTVQRMRGKRRLGKNVAVIRAVWHETVARLSTGWCSVAGRFLRFRVACDPLFSAQSPISPTSFCLHQLDGVKRRQPPRHPPPFDSLGLPRLYVAR